MNGRLTLSDGNRREARSATEKRTEQDEFLTRDDVFHVLRNRRRRYALHFLAGSDDVTDIGELAEQVAAWENGVDPARVTSTQRKRAYNSLQQTHLPTLDDVGLVEYEPARGTVAVTDRTAEFDVYLDVVAGDDIAWGHYYLALASVSAFVVVAAATDLFPFSALPDVAWTAFVAASLFASATVHVYSQRSARLGSNAEPPEVREGRR